MSATSTTTAGAAAYLPAPPQQVVDNQTVEQKVSADNVQFGALLKILGGTTHHRRGCRCKRCQTKKRKRSRGKSRGGRHRKRSHTKRRTFHRRRRTTTRRVRGGAGTTTTSLPLTPQPVMVVPTVPDKTGGVSYPNATDIQVKLAGAIAQNGANAALDKPPNV